MKSIIKFSQARIRDLPVPATGRKDYYDEEVKKLVCRVTAAGSKSYAVIKKTAGVTKRVTIGSTDDYNVSQARERALNILSDLAAGVDPVAVKRRKKAASSTLSDILDQYLDSRALKPQTVSDYKYKVDHCFADWKDKPVAGITEKMILDKHKSLTKTGQTTANTAFRVLRLLLRYAEAVGVIDDNPAQVLNKARLWHKNKRKDRVIPSEKLADWLDAVEALESVRARVYLLTMLHCGFRSTELLNVRWGDVNLRSHTITLHDTKNGSDHTLPIPKILHTHFKQLKKLTGKTAWVFAADDESLDQSMDRPRRAMRAVSTASGVEFSPHDLRRTFATIAAEIVPYSTVKRLLNHTDGGDVTLGYVRTSLDSLRDAVERVAAAIDELRMTAEAERKRKKWS